MRLGLRSEKFQEAFERFERVVDIDSFDSYRGLVYGFERWAGKRWIPTDRQLSALAYEAEIRGIFVPVTPRVKWAKAYKKKVRRTRKSVIKKYKGIGKVRINTLSWYVNRGYSANKIQKRMECSTFVFTQNICFGFARAD